MLTSITSLLHRPFGRYLIIGGFGYLFEILVITGCRSLGASAVLAISISFWLGTLLSFFLQKIIAFRDRRMHSRILIPQAMAVTVLIVWNYGFTVLLTSMLDNSLPVTAIRTIALIITTAWNYFLYKKLIFKQN